MHTHAHAYNRMRTMPTITKTPTLTPTLTKTKAPAEKTALSENEQKKQSPATAGQETATADGACNSNDAGRYVMTQEEEQKRRDELIQALMQRIADKEKK